MTDVIIIGAGIFGSVLATHLRAKGRTVLVIDAGLPNAGSGPAACLMRPSWFSSLGQGVTRPALELLDGLYGLEELIVRVGFGSTSVYRVDRERVLLKHFVDALVTGVSPAPRGWSVHCGKTTTFEARNVVVAAGVWSPTLVPVEGGLEGHGGMAFLWPGKTVQPFTNCWSPYRQVVAVNQADGVWVSDGHPLQYLRAVQNAEEYKQLQADGRYLWATEETTQSWAEGCFSRCLQAVKFDEGEPVQKMFGIRPYSKKKSFVFDEVKKGLWVATGGAKNGTIAAGWCAYDFEKRTQ